MSLQVLVKSNQFQIRCQKWSQMLLCNLHKTCKNQFQVHNLNWVQSLLWLLQQFHMVIKNLKRKQFLIQNQILMPWLVHCKLWPCKINKLLQLLACNPPQQVQKKQCQLAHNLNKQLVDQVNH